MKLSDQFPKTMYILFVKYEDKETRWGKVASGDLQQIRQVQRAWTSNNFKTRIVRYRGAKVLP
jgi:hypothetical protein